MGGWNGVGTERTQLDVIRDFMLGSGDWLTLDEIESVTCFPVASISAQLRHLRKRGFLVEKRIRVGLLWEYRVRRET